MRGLAGLAVVSSAVWPVTGSWLCHTVKGCVTGLANLDP